MKKAFVLTVMICMASCLINITYAAFPVKTTHTITETTASPAIVINSGSVKQSHHPSRIARFFHVNDIHKPNDTRPGWPGVAALVCGIIGFFPGAIVFGIIGLNKRYKYHGMALAGLILGVLDVVFVAVIFIIIINSFKAGMSGVI